MDKYEYKVRSEEIKTLIAEGAYAEAAEIADTIDWRRVKSVMMLCTVSDLYKVNRRYEDAKNMLLLAYEKKPGGRTICYSLCELCIKTEEFVQAVSYYNEFMRVAPKDPERYILQYKLYEAQDVNLEERIGVLEELKKRDYREKWAYELAYLYHRVGLATRCVEECDELILWFGEGKYVVKAMELKMLHQPLTPDQQDIYDHRFDEYTIEESEPYAEEAEPYVEDTEHQEYEQQNMYGQMEEEPLPFGEYDNEAQETPWEETYGEPVPEEMDIQVKTVDVGKYNTINLQEELAAGLQEVLGGRNTGHEETAGEAVYDDMETEETEVFFGETGDIEEAQLEVQGACFTERADIREQGTYSAERGEDELLTPDFGQESVSRKTGAKERRYKPKQESRKEENAEGSVLWKAQNEEDERQNDLSAAAMQQMREEMSGAEARPPRELADVLRQETDGQIRMVLPEQVAVEKQLTGQMNIEDILAEWERMKKENQEKCREEVRQHVLRQTGPMFTEFEAAVRDGLLEQLEGRAAKQSGGAGTVSAAEAMTGETLPKGPDGLGNSYGEDAEYKDQAEAQPGEAYGEEAGYKDQAEEQPEKAYEEEAAGYEEWPQEQSGEVYGEDAGYEDQADVPPGGAYGEETGYEDQAEAQPGEVYGEDAGYEEWPQEQPGEMYGEDAGYEQWPEIAAESGSEYREHIPVDTIYEEEGKWEQDGGDDLEVSEYSEESGHETEAKYDDQPQWDEDQDGVADYQEASEYIKDEGTGLSAEGDGEDGEGAFLENRVSEDSESEGVDFLDVLEHVEEYEDQNGRQDTQAALDSDGFEKTDAEAAFETSESAEEKASEKPARSAEGHSRLSPEREKVKVRSLTREEKELFAPFIQSRQSREQLVKVIDGISMAAYTGNVVVTGEEGMDTLTLAKNIIREVKMTDRNFSGKVAKITGKGLNQKNVRETLEGLVNGALIIQKASGMDNQTAGMLHVALQQEKFGIIVIMEDTKKAVQKLFLGTPQLFGDFPLRMDLEALSNDTLVSFGRRYAREKEYSIDDLGMLALHTRIEESQTIDHVVTVIEVKQIVDEAIRHANRKTIGHFFDILLARRYDDEDMIILTEKDFVA